MKEEHGWQTAVRMPEIWKSRLENLGRKLSPYVHLQNPTIIRAVIERGLSTLEKEHGINFSASVKTTEESGSDTGKPSRLARRTAAAEGAILTSNEPHITRRGGARAKKEEAAAAKEAAAKETAAKETAAPTNGTERKPR